MTLENRKCKICGKEFKPKVHNAVYCSKKHKKTCKYCGEEFECNNDVYYKRECCYKSECKKKSKKESLKNSAEKIYKTKKCEICGKEFKPNNSNQKYCSKTHKKECIICGKMFEVESSRYNRVKCCSKKCNALLGNQTYFEKHGKYKNFKNKELRENAQQSMLKKYGTTNVSNIPGTKEKTEQTNLKKYGVKNVLEKDSEFRKKIEDDNLKNFGSISPMGNPKIKEKIRQTNQEKYGVDYPLQNNEILSKTRSREIKNLHDWNNFNAFIKENNNKYTIENLMEYFNLKYETIRKSAIENNLTSYIKDFYVLTKIESDALKIICDFYNVDENKIKIHDRKEIAPKEIDIFIPNIRIGFEISPSFTHNLDYIEKYNYHYEKFKIAEEKNIDLITIFDWMDIKEVLNNRNKLDLNKEVIRTDNSYGNYNWLKEYGYQMIKEIPPIINYYNHSKKIHSLKEVKEKNFFRVEDCGYRIWKKDN